MAQRTFRDERKRLWIVTEVHPQLAERRKRPGTSPTGVERRRTEQRRVQLPDALSGGWLTFTTAGERRRLAPIPPEWMSAPDVQLAIWCAAAVRLDNMKPAES